MQWVQITRLQVKNPHPYPLILHIEPWGEELVMPAGRTYEVVAEGPHDGCLEVSSQQDHFFVFGWSGSVVSVFQGQDLLYECRIPVPPTPPGCR